MKNIYLATLILATGTFIMVSCGGGSNAGDEAGDNSAQTPKSMIEKPSSYDPQRGEGKYNKENVSIGPLDVKMATIGQDAAETKCTSCHRLTEEKLVGPGWKGVTTRHEPFWIMNFITNPDPMIDKDPVLQAQLEMCLVRMPNQGLSDDEARNIVEYMRQLDGAQ
jgi:hypothetical protein